MIFVHTAAAAQESDTLSAAAVYGAASRPVIRPAEQVDMDSQIAEPTGVAKALMRLTGVQVKDYGGIGGLKTINVRSLGSEHAGVFLDGIQVDNAQNMQVDLGRFSSDGIGTIDLYNAQKAQRLQTAKEYACGASVHLSTSRPMAPGGRYRLRFGSFSTAYPSLQWDFRLAPGLFLRLSTDFVNSDGRYKFRYFDTTLVRANGDIRALRAEAQLFGQLRSGEWDLHIYSYGSERGFPGPVVRKAMGTPFSAERQADQDIFVQGGWQQEWSPHYSTALKFKYSNNYIHYDAHSEKNPNAMPWNIHYRQQSGYLSLAQSVVIAGPWSADLCTDIQFNTLDSDMGHFVFPRRLTFTGALATRLILERFRVAAHIAWVGARDWFLNHESDGWSREDTWRDAWMPSLSFSWLPLSWLEVDAYAKQTYRLPSFNDLYYSLIGNSALTPERASQFGMDLRSDGRFWEVRVSPYYNRVSDKILAIPTYSQFRWTMLNIGVVDVLGVDAKILGKVETGALRLSAAVRYSLQQALDHSDPESLVYGNQIPYIPLHSGGVDIAVRYRAWILSWTTGWSGEKWSRTANIPDYHIEPWTESDAALFWEIGGLRFGLNVNNIFNRHYQIVQGYPMPGTNFMLSLEYTW